MSAQKHATIFFLLLLSLTLVTAAPPPELAHLPHADLVAQVVPDNPQVQAKALNTQQVSKQDAKKYLVLLEEPKNIPQLQKALAQMPVDEQAQLKQTMRAFAINEQQAPPRHKYKTFNAFATTLTQEEKQRLENNPLVRAIDPNLEVKKMLSESLPLINATATWDLQIQSTNLTGKSTAVCIIDTGVDYTHSALGGCTQSEFLNGTCEKTRGGYDFVNNDTNPIDDDGHGTHVAGIAAASGSVNGVAKEANIVAIKALSGQGTGSFEDVVAGIDWCVDNKDAYNITAIGMSLGTACEDGNCWESSCDEVGGLGTVTTAIDNAVAAGISVAAAAGNENNHTHISAPACISSATAVASSTDADIVSSFSNRNAITPLIAPGSDITSTWVGGGTNTISGTSMATPHVVGAMAILHQQSVLANLSYTPAQIESLLETTGVPIFDNSSQRNYSRIDIFAAVGLDAPISTASFPGGWQNQPFNVTLNSTSDGFEINYTSYRLNNGPWVNATTLLINESREHTLEFFSVNTNGEKESTQSVFPLLDMVAPTTSTNNSGDWNKKIGFNAFDNLSGVQNTSYSIDGGAWVNGTEVVFNESGNFSLEFFSVDVAGNQENISNTTVLVDVTNPLLVLSAPSGWQTSDFVANWSASDNLSGINRTEYRVDGGSWTQASNTSFNQSGNFTLVIRAVDNVGNVNESTYQALLDKDAPITADDAPAGWSNQIINVTLYASDILSGVNYTSYRLNEGSWINGTSIIISSTGNTTIDYFSVDALGNQESLRTADVAIDQESPTTTSDAPTGWQAQPVTVPLSASDNLSGVQNTSYRVNGESWVNGTEVVFNESGNFTLEFFSVDVAGNQENITNTSVLVDLDAPLLNVSAPTGWQNASFNVSFNSSDVLSGVSSFSIQVGNQTPNNETFVTIVEEGNFSVTINVFDAVNNSANFTVQALLDLTPPNTSVDVPAGWQNTTITVVFNVSDNLSGVNYTEYRVNGTWVEASNATFTDGNYSLEYRSVDFAGNHEPVKNATLLIDTIPPAITNFSINNSQLQANESIRFSATITELNTITNASLTIANSTQQLTLTNNSFIQDEQLPLGTYNATLHVIDQANNTAQQVLSFTVYEKQSFSQNISDTQLDAKNTTRTRLRLKTNQTIAANVTILSSKQKPSTVNKTLPRAIRHSTINLSQNAKDALEWANLSIGYDEADLDALNASTLRMALYNESADEWVTLTNNRSWVHAVGVDTTNQEVWANVTHFSTYAITADESVTPQEEDDDDSSDSSNTGSSGGGSSGGGGGGGGGAVTSQTSNQTSRTQTFIQAGEQLRYSFNNPELAIKQVRFTAQENTGSLTLTLKRETPPSSAPTGTQEYYVLEHPSINVTNVTIDYQASQELFLWRLGDEWQVLEREQLSSGSYQATSLGLSEFALAPNEQEEPQLAQTQPINETPSVNESTTPLANQSAQQEQQPETSQPEVTRSKTAEVILLAILAGIAVLVALATIFERSWNARD